MTTTTNPANPSSLFAYVGHGNATGDIEIFGFDAATGALSPRAVVPSGSSTSFFALHPSRLFAYTAQNRSNRVSAFAVDRASGHLRPLNEAPVPPRAGETEAGPAYVSVDAQGRFLLVANYRGHNTVVFRLRDDGGVGDLVSDVTAGTHAHCVALAPDNRHALVPNLGSDLIAQYQFDANSGALTPAHPPSVASAKGAGPRHLVFAPGGTLAFVVNELDATLSSYAFDDGSGTLQPLATVATLPPDYQGRRWAGDVQVHPNGRFVFMSNRAHDSLVAFAIEDGGRRLRLVTRTPCGGTTPRNFTLSPSGSHLLVANQDSGNLVTFAVDATGGQLTLIDDRAVAPAPYFVRVVDLG